MARRKKAAVTPRNRKSGTRRARPYSFAGDTNAILHQLFQKQAEEIIAATDASDDEKQQMLLAMNCPCCGLGASSFSIRLRRQAAPAPHVITDDGGKS